ncbi:tetratricopeptide repeat protein [Nostoc sp. UIC 10607]|uniref:protein kinase domain-containing protein n=1 Tax=Nostoc sp. UIC 10607 TaxID=3045935 RepID=UPI00399F9E70
MSYCINPKCKQRQNPDDIERCLNCGTELLIDQRFRLIKPLRPLDFRYNTEIFEVVDDEGTHKVIKVLGSQKPKEISLLERETLTLQLFNHPGIPRVIDDLFTVTLHNSSSDLHCLIMQKFEGQNLEQWMEANGRISQALALNWLIQLVKILDEVHRSGFFHRDIKPSNIIVQPDGQLGLIDFGAVREVTRSYLAKVSGSGGNDMGMGQHEVTVLVTAGYTPLEQINGQAVPQSDFYALGRTLVYLVTGLHVLDLPADPNTTRLIWRDKAQHIEKPFADLLDDLIAPAPGQRPISTQILLARLEDLPRQLKNFRFTQSKTFKISASVGLFALGVLFIFKILLPLGANIFAAQGEISEAANDSQGAQEYFKLAVKFNPQVKNSIAKFYFDKASRSTKNLRDGKKYYELSLKYNNQDVDTYNNLAFVCQLLNEFECVTNNYEKALKLKPDTWGGRYGLGSFYDDQGKNDLAEQQYYLALKSNSQAIPVINNLSRLKIIKSDYNAATSLALEGLKNTKEPKLQAALYKNLGWAKLEQKKWQKAKEYLEKAEELDPQRADTYCLLAQVQEALGDNDNSWLSWEVCLLFESKQPEVFRWRSKVLERIRLKPSSPQ